MEKSIFLAGVGGQGMQSVGKELIYAADKAGLTVTYSPLYTFEKRGGLSSAYVVLSTAERIGSPRKEFHDIVVVMNQYTFDYSKNSVKPGGALIINSSIVRDTSGMPDGISSVELPFLDIAAELGNPKVVSTLILGVVARTCGMFPDIAAVKDTALESLKKKPDMLTLNAAAFDKGVALAEDFLDRR